MGDDVCKNVDELGALLCDFIVDKNDFKVGKRLGKGGFSRVYAGIQKSTHLICAIKVLNYKNLKNDRFLLYEREVRILAACQNPFLMGFVGFTTTPPYTIITEYVGHGCLYDVLRPEKGQKVLTGTEKTVIALGIAHGMRRLHSLNIIHRDLKSLNILLDKNYLPKICDFGLGRYIEPNENEYMTTNVGTSQWMAPEMFESGRYDEKVDVYSYGVLLWEMLTGETPFDGKTCSEIATAVIRQGRRPPMPHRVPEKLADLINACWNADPKKRPSFDKILTMFRTHKVKFAETNDLEVDNVLKMAERPTRKHHQVIRDIEPELPEHLRASKPKDVFNLDKVKAKDEKHEAQQKKMPEVGSPNFVFDFNTAAENITALNSDEFFGMVDSYITHKHISNEHLKVVVQGVKRIFKKDKLYIRTFIDRGTYLRMPQHCPASPDIAEIFLYIVTFFPSNVTPPLIQQIGGLSIVCPDRALKIMMQYIKSHPQQIYVKEMQREFMANASNFVKARKALLFLQVLYTMASTDQAFAADYKDQINHIYSTLVNDNDAEVVLFVLRCVVGGKNTEILESIPLSKLLMSRTTNEAAIMFCLSYVQQLTFDQQLVRGLLSNSQTQKNATYVLMEACQRPEVSTLIAQMSPIWVCVPLPTIRMTMKLLLRVMMNPTSRRVISQCTRLGNGLVLALDDAKARTSVATILSLLTMDANFVQYLSKSGFLDKYYRLILNANDPGMLSQGFSVTELFARACFTSEYLLLLPMLKRLLPVQGWQKFVVSLVTTLSIHQAAKPELITYGFREMLAPLAKDPYLTQYVNIYLRNISQ